MLSQQKQTICLINRNNIAKILKLSIDVRPNKYIVKNEILSSTQQTEIHE